LNSFLIFPMHAHAPPPRPWPTRTVQ
jgi:hypothetical protein